MKKCIVAICLVYNLVFKMYAQSFTELKLISFQTETSIRGISIPSPATIWISGSNGKVGISQDSGLTFRFFDLENYKKSDFRDIHALNDTVALTLNAGSPGVILKTENAGITWREVYKNTLEKIFFDGFDFWDKQHGIAFSDPINNKLFIITTHDGGETWQEPDSLDIPDCFEKEAGFAASGSGICCGKNGKVIIGTGGSHARVFISNDFGTTWKVIETPMLSGKATTGIFSTLLTSEGRIYVCGGDYKMDSLAHSGFFYTDDEGESWNGSSQPPSGYRSCIIGSGPDTLISTGSNGTDISTDRGSTWTSLSLEGFNVAGTCADCNCVFFAGSKHKTGLLKLK